MPCHRPLPNRSLAAAALAQNRLRLGGSFRRQDPRGAFCHSGWCQQCKVALTDGRVGLACQLSAEDLELLARPSLLRRPVGLLARHLRPWFHEAVLTRLSVLNAAFLGVVRRSSGALSLPAAHAGGGNPIRVETCETLVVGAGAAGLAAAEIFAKSGGSVLVIDAETPGPEPDALALGTRLHAATTAFGLYPDQHSPSGVHLSCVSAEGTLQARFEKLVVATGAYDRIPPVPGGWLPGVIGLKAFEKLAEIRALPPRARIMVFSGVSGSLRAAAAAKRANMRLHFAIGATELASDLAETVRPGVHPMRLAGRHRLRKVHLSDGTSVACDLLVCGYAQPSYEFQMQAGQALVYSGAGHPVVTAGPTPFPVIVVGEAAGSTRPEAAEHARRAVTAWLADRTVPDAAGEALPGPAMLEDDVILCPCEDVTAGDVKAAIRDGYDRVEHVKRRTGAGTGPCQGKLCHSALLQVLVECGSPAELPTVRPLARPVTLASFAPSDHG